ncbi:hypothetical protein D9M71_505650 [compost metagenome]
MLQRGASLQSRAQQARAQYRLQAGAAGQQGGQGDEGRMVLAGCRLQAIQKVGGEIAEPDPWPARDAPTEQGDEGQAGGRPEHHCMIGGAVERQG